MRASRPTRRRIAAFLFRRGGASTLSPRRARSPDRAAAVHLCALRAQAALGFIPNAVWGWFRPSGAEALCFATKCLKRAKTYGFGIPFWMHCRLPSAIHPARPPPTRCAAPRLRLTAALRSGLSAPALLRLLPVVGSGSRTSCQYSAQGAAADKDGRQCGQNGTRSSCPARQQNTEEP